MGLPLSVPHPGCHRGAGSAVSADDLLVYLDLNGNPNCWLAADEIRRLRAEVERMRPVIEAARALAAADTAVLTGTKEWMVWGDAEARLYTAVAALDAGEPQ